MNTQPLEQQRSVEDILAEYRDRATKIARWQARLNEPIDPGMRTYLEGLIASEQGILNTLGTNAMNAGATQSQLNQINQEAQVGAENDPIEWQEGDGGESVLLAAYIGFQFGKVQGILNSFNGVTDIGTGMINQGINVTNPLGWALGTNSQIPLVDWSKGLITDEDPVLHEWSKELGGNGIVLLASVFPFLPKGTVRVFRVEGTPNSHVVIGEGGTVAIQSEGQVVWLNFGNQARAEKYLARKIADGLPAAKVKSFLVPRSVLDKLRATAVPEDMVATFPNSPIISRDPFPGQYGLRPHHVEELIKKIIQGSGKVGF